MSEDIVPTRKGKAKFEIDYQKHLNGLFGVELSAQQQSKDQVHEENQNEWRKSYKDHVLVGKQMKMVDQ